MSEYCSVVTTVHTRLGMFESLPEVMKKLDLPELKKHLILALSAGTPLALDTEGGAAIITPAIMQDSVIEIEVEDTEAPNPLDLAGGLWVPGCTIDGKARG